MNSYKDMFALDDVELKVVRIFLLAFIILLVYQTVQFINTRRIDKQHSELLLTRNQSVGEVQNLLIQSSTIQRKLLNMALTADPAEMGQLKRIIEQAAESNDKSLAELQAAYGKLSASINSDASGLKNASDDYRNTYNIYIDMISAGKTSSALEYKDSHLRPAYENYQQAQQQALVRITDDLISKSKELSSYAATSGWILFFLGLAPFIYAIAKLIYLSVFLKFKSVRVSGFHKESDHKA